MYQIFLAQNSFFQIICLMVWTQGSIYFMVVEKNHENFLKNSLYTSIFFYIGDIIADWFFEVIFYNWNFHISIYKIVFLIFSPDLFLFLLERVIILGRYFICLWIVHITENASNDICHFIHIPLFSPFFLIFVCSQVKLVPKSNFRGLENLSLFCYSVVFFIWIFNNWIEN